MCVFRLPGAAHDEGCLISGNFLPKTWRMWVTTRPPPFLVKNEMVLDSDQLKLAKIMWEVDGLTATEIGLYFGVTKNAIMGQVVRQDWVKAGKEPEATSTIMTRLDALHARMDNVLKELGASSIAVRKIIFENPYRVIQRA